MKILYLITKSNWGGAQMNVYQLATSMAKLGHEAVVALGGNGILKEKLDKAGIRTISVESMGRDISVFKDISSALDIFNLIRKERPDIIHLHSPKASGIGALCARLIGIKKIVYTVHGWTFNEDRPFYQKFLIAIASWTTTILSTHVINISQKETGQTLQFPFVKKKVRYIPNGIPEIDFINQKEARDFISEKISDKISKEELKNSKIWIGTISELHKNKGLRYLLQGIKEVEKDYNDLSYFIIGKGDEEKELQKMIDDLGLGKKVFLVGFIDQAPRYLKAFNIFTLTSIKEGLPYVLLEAGKAGLPCISTLVGGIGDIIEDMKSGILIQPKKSTEIANAIRYVLSNKDAQREYGKNLEETVKQNYSLEKMISKIEALYKE